MRSPPLRSDSRHCRRDESVKSQVPKASSKTRVSAIAALALTVPSRVQSVQRHYASLPPRVMPTRIIATVPPPVSQSRYARMSQLIAGLRSRIIAASRLQRQASVSRLHPLLRLRLTAEECCALRRFRGGICRWQSITAMCGEVWNVGA